MMYRVSCRGRNILQTFCCTLSSLCEHLLDPALSALSTSLYV